MSLPLVSIIIPVYNSAPYLAECLDNILIQKDTPLEIIAIDDCSTDNSWSLLRRYAQKDQRLRLYRSPCHQGAPSYGRNLGIEQARGTLIAFMDSDDFMPSALPDNRSATMTHIAAQMMQTQADIGYAHYHIFDDRDRKKYHLWDFSAHAHKDSSAPLFSPHSANFAFWDNFNSGACFKIYRTAFLQEQKLYFDKLHFEDLSFSLKSCLSAKRILQLRSVWYHYRIRRQYGTSRGATRTLAQCTEGLEGLQKTQEWLQQRGLWLPFCKKFTLVAVSQTLRWLRDNAPAAGQQSFARHLRTYYQSLRPHNSSLHYFLPALKKAFTMLCTEQTPDLALVFSHIAIKNQGF